MKRAVRYLNACRYPHDACSCYDHISDLLKYPRSDVVVYTCTYALRQPGTSLDHEALPAELNVVG